MCARTRTATASVQRETTPGIYPATHAAKSRQSCSGKRVRVLPFLPLQGIVLVCRQCTKHSPYLTHPFRSSISIVHSLPPMPREDTKEKNEEGGEEDTSPTSQASFPFQKQTRTARDLFSVPLPVKKLFDKVPVVTYPPNHLPQRAPKITRIPSLYVFSTNGDAAAAKPSFNPSCLKWQVSDGLGRAVRPV